MGKKPSQNGRRHYRDMVNEIARLKRQLNRANLKLDKAERIIEIQKKISAALEADLQEPEKCEDV